MSGRRSGCWWLPAFVWACVILVGTSAPTVPVPSIRGIDKVLHLIAYGVFGLLLANGFYSRQRRSFWRAAMHTLLIGGVFGALDEWHQSFIPGRTMSFGDFVADVAGLVLGVGIFWMLRRLIHGKKRVVCVKHSRTAKPKAHTREEMTTMAEPLHLDEDNFDSDVLQADQPALIDFWAPWCGPCLMMTPTLEKLAGDYEGTAIVGKVNVDDSPDLASKYGIRSIPALLFFKGGEVVDQLVGVQSEDALKAKLDALK